MDDICFQCDKLYLCNYPFLFNAEAKTLLLQTDQAIQMQTAMSEAATRAFLSFFTSMGNSVCQYLVLNVSRENLVLDALRELTEVNTSDLKKPLKVIISAIYSILNLYQFDDLGEIPRRRSR